MVVAVITRDILEGYLNCKYLAYLRLGGHEGARSDYEEVLLHVRRQQMLATTEALSSRYARQGVSSGINLICSELRHGTAFVLDAELRDDSLHIRFDGLKKVDGYSDLGAFHYVPTLFSESRRVHRTHRLLLEMLGVLLGRVQGRAPLRGIMYHGTSCTATSVPFSAGLRAGEDALHDLARMQRAAAVPKHLLNDHCRICEFRDQCRTKATNEDNLTLLRSVGQKEMKRYARRGLFTLTQLAHTFQASTARKARPSLPSSRPRAPGSRDPRQDCVCVRGAGSALSLHRNLRGHGG
jgi:predicted RecB family nuclease